MSALEMIVLTFRDLFKIPAIWNSVHPVILARGSRMLPRFHSKYQQCSTLHFSFQYLGHMDHSEYCEQKKSKREDFCSTTKKSSQHSNYEKKIASYGFKNNSHVKWKLVL